MVEAIVMREPDNEVSEWLSPPSSPVLGSDEVDIWAASLDVSPQVRQALQATLSSVELERAARFHFESHRSRWIVARGLFRTLLGKYLGVPASEIAFEHGSAGKPFLRQSSARAPLHFNLSHSENLALFGFTRASAIGVDVERIRVLEDADQLVARFFSPNEAALFANLPGDQKPEAFFNLWTRKEAWLKATGEGIAHSLHLVEVTFLPGEPARLRKVPSDLAQGHEWSLHDLRPAPQFAACVATTVQPRRVRCWHWSQPGDFSGLRARGGLDAS